MYLKQIFNKKSSLIKNPDCFSRKVSFFLLLPPEYLQNSAVRLRPASGGVRRRPAEVLRNAFSKEKLLLRTRNQQLAAGNQQSVTSI